MNVAQAKRAQDARRLIEAQRYDIVVCEYHFDGEPVSGQDLMDDLRLSQMLPLSTVVVMISSEAGYAKVAEAAEAALDAFLVRPHTQDALRERLLKSRQRKKLLKTSSIWLRAKTSLKRLRFARSVSIPEAPRRCRQRA